MINNMLLRNSYFKIKVDKTYINSRNYRMRIKVLNIIKASSKTINTIYINNMLKNKIIKNNNKNNHKKRLSSILIKDLKRNKFSNLYPTKDHLITI